MSQIIHDISFPNDGLGDPLRDAFGNQNAMNTELYTTKVDKVVGMGLSTNDYTNAEKTKLAGIEAGAEVNVQADWEQNDNTQKDYIKNKPNQLFASVGYFDHNDLATHTTPITLSSGVSTKLTNDADGAFTDLTKAPYGVNNIWNTTTNQFDFSSLDVGDTLDLRVDFLLTTTGTNKTCKVFLKLAVGTASEYTILVGSSELKAAVTNEEIVKEIGFYIGSEDVKTAPAELYILIDTAGSVKVNGWYTRILRKNLNIVSIIGGEDKLDKNIFLYPDATLPLSDTDELIVNQGDVWKKVDKSELGGSSFQGSWNAETNTPTLANGIGTTGHEYKVSVSGYVLNEIYLENDFVIYDGANWVKSRDNNQDIATRYPVSYTNCNSGIGVQNLGEYDAVENSGAINAAAVADDYISKGGSTYQNTRRFRTQALANSLTTYRNTSWNRIYENMGFYACLVVANADVSSNSASRFFFGISGGFVVGNTDPSATTGYAIGLAADSADTNVQLFVKVSTTPSTGVTKVDTGLPKTSLHTYYLKLFRDRSSSKVFYWLRNTSNTTEIKGVFTFNPTAQNLLKDYRKGSGANAISSGFHHLSTTIKTQI